MLSDLCYCSNAKDGAGLAKVYLTFDIAPVLKTAQDSREFVIRPSGYWTLANFGFDLAAPLSCKMHPLGIKLARLFGPNGASTASSEIQSPMGAVTERFMAPSEILSPMGVPHKTTIHGTVKNALAHRGAAKSNYPRHRTLCAPRHGRKCSLPS